MNLKDGIDIGLKVADFILKHWKTIITVLGFAGASWFHQSEMSYKDEQISMTQNQVATVAESYRTSCVQAESSTTAINPPEVKLEKPSRLIESLILEHVRKYH